MQESITIKLPPEALEEISSSGDPSAAVQQLLLKNVDSVTSLLVGYHFRSRGSVSDVEIEKQSLEFNGQGTGRFKATYTLGIFNACADLSFSDKEKMTLTFSIDKTSGELTLTGEYIPERGPDEF